MATAGVMSRTTGAFFLVGGLLGATVIALTGNGSGDRAIVSGTTLAAVVAGVVVYLTGERMPVRAHPFFVVLATALITIAIHWFPNVITTVTLSSFYVFIACDAAFFFTPGVAGLEIALAVLCCMVALATRDQLTWWIGVVPAGVTVVVGVVVAILARMAADADIDVLTGLLNRRGFDRLLNAEIARAGRLGRRPAMILADLDGFRKINEDLGRRAGDAVLQEVADAWSKLLGPVNKPARIRGDLFAVLLPDTTEQAAIGATDRMRTVVATGCSAGVTSWRPGESASLLIRRAAVALYRAKQAGSNQTGLESGEGIPPAEELREAIADDTFDVGYQPIVSLPSGGRVVAVEALLRWSPPAEPGLGPDAVIRVAEEYNLIADLDRAVLRRACTDASRLQNTLVGLDLTLSVNVSGQELTDPEYAEQVCNTLRSTGWPADQLVLEVTETQLAAESQSVVDNLNRLRGSRVRIALDDFGTGYSSLSRLAAIPSDILKVDRSFVAAITADSPVPPLLEVIKMLSVALGVEVVAEGVENEHQAAILTDLGFALAQGYLYGRARTVQEILDEIGEQRATAARRESPAPLSWIRYTSTEYPP